MSSTEPHGTGPHSPLRLGALGHSSESPARTDSAAITSCFMISFSFLRCIHENLRGHVGAPGACVGAQGGLGDGGCRSKGVGACALDGAPFTHSEQLRRSWGTVGRLRGLHDASSDGGSVRTGRGSIAS
jgi:hypothetical protein